MQFLGKKKRIDREELEFGLSAVKEKNRQNEANLDSIENKIKKISKNDIGKIFKKLEPNAYPWDIQQREKLLHNIDMGNQLDPADYIYISTTYSSHINELFPEIDNEQDNNWIISVTVIYIIVGIGLRIFLNPYKQPVLLFMGVLGILAAGLAIFVLTGSINKRISTWISQSVLLGDDIKILQSKYCKTKHLLYVVAWIFEIIIVAFQVCLYSNELLAIGNDVISILAFGIALFSENVERLFVRIIETKLTEVEL